VVGTGGPGTGDPGATDHPAGAAAPAGGSPAPGPAPSLASRLASGRRATAAAPVRAGRHRGRRRSPPIHEQVLDSGARVLVDPVPGRRTVAIGVWFAVGSRDEDEAQAGVAHFVEHLLFKGSAGRDARALAQAMDRLGGQFNAFTTKEHTCFHARVLAEHFPAAAALLAELVLRPRFRSEDVERERGVVLAELAAIDDDPAETAEELFARALWGRHPLGRPQAGTARGVESCGTESVRAFHAEHYVGRRAVIAVAGPVEPAPAVEALAGAFAALPAGGEGPGRVAPLAACRRLRQPRASEQAHVLLGVPGPALGDPRRYAGEVVASILGGSPSSRLFQALREERGLCYDVGTSPAAYTDAGELAVFLATAPARAREAVAVTQEEVRRLAAEGVGEAELALHKDLLLTSLWMGMDGTEARMARLGLLGVSGVEVVPPEEVAARLAAVSAAEVQEFARALGDPSTWAAAYVGPRRGTPAGWRWEDAPEAPR
jgi:predicted Zn-dependent peptidase